MTTEGFDALFETLEAGSGRSLTEKEKNFWRLNLAEDDDVAVMSALRRFYRSDQAGKRKERIPAPGDLIAQPQARADATALAWATLRKAISSVGSYRSVEFEDAAIAATVEALGGWLELCTKTSK